MGQSSSVEFKSISFIGGILLAFSILDVIAIYFVSRGGYQGKFALIDNLNIVGVPNPDFFKFVYPFLILTAAFGYFISSNDPGVYWRWILFIILTFLFTFFLFSSEGVILLPLALVVSFALVILLGESIYYLGITRRNKAATALLGLAFLQAIYSIYFVFALQIELLKRANL